MEKALLWYRRRFPGKKSIENGLSKSETDGRGKFVGEKRNLHLKGLRPKERDRRKSKEEGGRKENSFRESRGERGGGGGVLIPRTSLGGLNGKKNKN